MSIWLQRVGSSVPRGFSRHYILELLKKRPCTGKEIINSAIKQSDGKWNPSPGLIYPLLGRLLDENLIEESKNGKYHITRKGRTTTDDLETINNIVKNQLDVMFRVGNVGKFVAMDLLERISSMANILTSNMPNMTTSERTKYKKLLQSELRKTGNFRKKTKGKTVRLTKP